MSGGVNNWHMSLSRYCVVDKAGWSSYSVGQVELVSVIKQLSQKLTAAVISPDCLVWSQYSVLSTEGANGTCFITTTLKAANAEIIPRLIDAMYIRAS